MNILNELWLTFLDIVFPKICICCKQYIGKSGAVLCNKCYTSIPIANAFSCGGCGKRLPTNNGRVLACTCKKSCILGAASTYEKGPLIELITALKFKGTTQAVEPLGELIARFIREVKFDPNGFIIIPVPLSSARERNRGYNQAELIARAFSHSFKEVPLELHANIIKRIKNSDPQTLMSSREARQNNIFGAFTVLDPVAIKGKNVLLIDDVYTSGATAKEIISELKAAGARKVIVLTAARA